MVVTSITQNNPTLLSQGPLPILPADIKVLSHGALPTITDNISPAFIASPAPLTDYCNNPHTSSLKKQNKTHFLF